MFPRVNCPGVNGRISTPWFRSSTTGVVGNRGFVVVVDVGKNVALWRDIAERITSADDLIQTFDNGSTNVSAMQSAKDKAESAILKIAARLGLSPMDRAKLFGAAAQIENTKNKQNDGDDLDAFMDQ